MFAALINYKNYTHCAQADEFALDDFDEWKLGCSSGWVEGVAHEDEDESNNLISFECYRKNDEN